MNENKPEETPRSDQERQRPWRGPSLLETAEMIQHTMVKFWEGNDWGHASCLQLFDRLQALIGQTVRMDVPTLDEVVRTMNSLGTLVSWDRCVVREDGGVAYGWIAREDGRSDFLCLYWGPGGFGQTNSSALHSRRISEILFGAASDHRDCQTIDQVFGAGKVVCQVPRKPSQGE
jgi:hypothetical protein